MVLGCKMDKIFLRAPLVFMEHQASDGSNWGGGCPSLPPPPRFVTRRHNTRHKKTRSQPFGCHNIFRKAVFPLWPIVFFVTCHNSLPPPPHPHPLSGAQIRSITASGVFGAHERLRATPLATNCWPAAPKGGGGVVGVLGRMESPPPAPGYGVSGSCIHHPSAALTNSPEQPLLGSTPLNHPEQF